MKQNISPNYHCYLSLIIEYLLSILVNICILNQNKFPLFTETIFPSGIEDLLN